jgi:hypothetical protein
MTDLIRYAAALEGSAARGPPPVEKWNPPYCGEMDLTIRRDGVWVHEGTPIGRARLVRLLSTVLKREGARYFLVTPAEKLGVRVEDAPFLAVLLRVLPAAQRQLAFTTNVGDCVIADAAHAISYRASPGGEMAPYLHVRAGLEARIARAPFFELVELGETRPIGGEEWFGVSSCGVFFPFVRAAQIFPV